MYIHIYMYVNVLGVRVASQDAGISTEVGEAMMLSPVRKGKMAIHRSENYFAAPFLSLEGLGLGFGI